MTATQTTVSAPHLQAGGATLRTGDQVTVTGSRLLGGTTCTVEGIVERIVEGLDGRLHVTVDVGGGHRETLSAEDIWIQVVRP